MVVEIIMEGGEHWDITDQKTSLAQATSRRPGAGVGEQEQLRALP